jgi:hypothetical protein
VAGVFVASVAFKLKLLAVFLHPQQHQRVLVTPQPPLSPGKLGECLFVGVSAIFPEEEGGGGLGVVLPAGSAETHLAMLFFKLKVSFRQLDLFLQ